MTSGALVSRASIASASVMERYARSMPVTLSLPAGSMVALIGPDGVGKSSFLSLIAGARQIQTGTVTVLGGDMADAAAPRGGVLQNRLYAARPGKEPLSRPQRRENIDFFARLFGQAKAERERRIEELTRARVSNRSTIGRPGNFPAACARSLGFVARSSMIRTFLSSTNRRPASILFRAGNSGN